MKFLLKRKKSAPEQELRKTMIEKNEFQSAKSYQKMSLPSNSVGALYTYQIYLNESCCIEINASQRDSFVSNILIQTLYKIKSSEDPNDFSLIEFIEYEISLKNMPIDYKKNNVFIQNKKSIKTRILERNENLFLLQNVWNQMKNEKKNGFKYAKIILTRNSLLSQQINEPLINKFSGINNQNKIKYSKLVRQKSFDESFDEVNKVNDQNDTTSKTKFNKLNDLPQDIKKSNDNDQNKYREKKNRRQSTSTLKRLFKF